MNTQQKILGLNVEQYQIFFENPTRAAIAVSLCSLYTGTIMTWPTQIRTELPNDLTSNKLAMLILILSALGNMSSGILLDKLKFSRKLVIFVNMAISMIGWILILANYLVIGTIILGISAGCFLSCVPLYIQEISTDDNKNRLLCYPHMTISIGILYITMLGLCSHHFKLYTSLCLIIPVLSIFIILLIPESPTFYLLKNMDDEALSIFENMYDYETANDEIQKRKDKMENVTHKTILQRIIGALKSRALLIILSVIVLLYLFTKYFNVNLLTQYNKDIFVTIGYIGGPQVWAIVFVSSQTVLSVFYFFIIKNWGQTNIHKVSNYSMLLALCSVILWIITYAIRIELFKICAFVSLFIINMAMCIRIQPSARVLLNLQETAIYFIGV